MKIIDLLNKIANGEEVPRKFEVNGRIWEWNVNSYNCELHSEFAVTGLRYDLSNLNDEIKILDIEYLNNDLGNKLIKPFLEEKKIPEKLNLDIEEYCINDKWESSQNRWGEKVKYKRYWIEYKYDREGV